MAQLNQFELSILNNIAKEYPVLKIHIPFLIVISREITGVGMYVHFDYLNQSNDLPLIVSSFHALSANETLVMEGLKNGLAYEISTTNGLIDFMELATCDEDWDGAIRKFWFEKR
jgi:hypothetical protein